jgi:hypothetical protein
MRIFLLALLVFMEALSAQAEMPACQWFRLAMGSYNELYKKSCQDVQQSKQCQDFYKQLSASVDAAEIAKRKLQCDRTALEKLTSALVPLPLKGSCRDGIGTAALDLVHEAVDLAGGAVHAMASVGNAISPLAAEQRYLQQQACNASEAEKKALIATKTSLWPKAMLPKLPADILKKDCRGIENYLDYYQKQLRANLQQKIQTNMPLTADEKQIYQYFAPGKSATNVQKMTIGSLAKSLMNDVGAVAMCYNFEYQTELYCEALGVAATFLLPGLSEMKAVRLGKFATMAGRKLTDAEIKALAKEAMEVSAVKGAERKALVSEAATNPASTLARVGNLKPADRLALARELLQRPLSKTESNAILTAHNMSTEQLFLKARTLRNAGLDTPEVDVMMRTSTTGQVSTTAASTTLKTTEQIARELPAGPSKSRLLGDMEGAKANPNINVMSTHFKDAAEAAEKKIGTLTNGNAYDLSNIEYCGSRWGSVAESAEEKAAAENLVGRAGRARLEKVVAEEAARASRMGIPFDKGKYVQEYLKSLESGQGKGFLARATQFQINAIKKAFNAAGWNL